MFPKSLKKRSAFLLLTLSLVMALMPASAPASYAATTLNFAVANYDAVGSPVFAAVGDFNQDGHSDIVTANNGTTNVSVFRNLGTGTFAAATNYNVGAHPYRVAVGDFNGDSYPDLVTASTTTNVRVLRNTGSNNFYTYVTYSTGEQPYGLAVGDFNGDSKLDIVTANWPNNSVSVLRNTTTITTGAASFAAAVIYPAGTAPQSVTVGDVNKDNHPDIIVASNSAVNVLLNNGNGTFASAVSYSASTTRDLISIALGDFNGDSWLDIVTADYDYTCNCAIVLLNNGNGTFGTAAKYDAGGMSVGNVVVGDFNLDGNLDIGSTNANTYNVSVLLNSGTGTFAVGGTFSVVGRPFGLAVGDFNGDGKPDLTTSNVEQIKANVLLNTTTYIPTLATEIHNASHTVITSAPVGATVHGKATVTGTPIYGTPTGGGTLKLYENATCTAPAVFTDTQTLQADGTAESSSFSAQSFYYQVTYAGDTNYSPVTSSCTLFSAYQPGPTFTVNTTTDDAGDNLCSDVHCTLREAITASNAYGSAATINFSVSGAFIPATAFPSVNHAAGATTVDGTGQTVNISGTLESATVSTLAGPLTVNNLQIDNGVTLVASAGSTLNVLGNWTNNGTFNAGTGTVIFSGAGTQNLAANTATTFNNLTVNSGVILVEAVSADNVIVAGALTNNGTIRKSQPVSSTGLKTFGLAGAYNGGTLSINVVTRGGMSNLQVDRIDSNHPNATFGPGNGTSTGRWWSITQTGGSGYVVDLTLPHAVLPDTNADVCEYTAGPGYGWDCARTSSTSNTVTRQNVTTLSPWAVGDNTGPTAITLTTLSGRSNGWALAGLWLAGLAILGAVVVVARKR